MTPVALLLKCNIPIPIHSSFPQSVSALSATTRDLAEFVNIVQQDTTSVVNDAATKVRKLINTVCKKIYTGIISDTRHRK